MGKNAMIKTVICLGLFLGLAACSSFQDTQNNYHDDSMNAEIQNDNMSNK